MLFRSESAGNPLLEGWRHVVAGGALQGVLRGEVRLEVRDGTLRLAED